MYVVTSVLIVAFFVFLVAGLSAGSDSLLGLGLVAWFLSFITMYVDIHDLDGKLWDTRPILWVIAAVLMYIIVAPLYIYKRSQV